MKYFLKLLFLAVAAPAMLFPAAGANAEEPLTPLATIFDGKASVKFLVCEGYPEDDSLEATVNACKEKIPGSYVIFNANGKGYFVTDNDEGHKARFTWSKSEDMDGVISVIRGERQTGYGFYRNKYANGYGGADTDLPLALEKE